MKDHDFVPCTEGCAKQHCCYRIKGNTVCGKPEGHEIHGSNFEKFLEECAEEKLTGPAGHP